MRERGAGPEPTRRSDKIMVRTGGSRRIVPIAVLACLGMLALGAYPGAAQDRAQDRRGPMVTTEPEPLVQNPPTEARRQVRPRPRVQVRPRYPYRHLPFDLSAAVRLRISRPERGAAVRRPAGDRASRQRHRDRAAPALLVGEALTPTIRSLPPGTDIGLWLQLRLEVNARSKCGVDWSARETGLCVSATRARRRSARRSPPPPPSPATPDGCGP